MFSRNGNTLINKAISGFVSAIDSLNKGIALNEKKLEANSKKLSDIHSDNVTLLHHNGRARNIISNIEALIK